MLKNEIITLNSVVYTSDFTNIYSDIYNCVCSVLSMEPNTFYNIYSDEYFYKDTAEKSCDEINEFVSALKNCLVLFKDDMNSENYKQFCKLSLLAVQVIRWLNPYSHETVVAKFEDGEDSETFSQSQIKDNLKNDLDCLNIMVSVYPYYKEISLNEEIYIPCYIIISEKNIALSNIIFNRNDSQKIPKEVLNIIEDYLAFVNECINQKNIYALAIIKNLDCKSLSLLVESDFASEATKKKCNDLKAQINNRQSELYYSIMNFLNENFSIRMHRFDEVGDEYNAWRNFH